MSRYPDLILAHAYLRWYARLGEGSGTTLDDIGPNNLDGTYAATGIAYGVAGAINGDANTAVAFAEPPVSDPATVADNNALDLADVFSLECWVKRSATQGAIQGLICKGTDAYVLRFASANTLQLFCGGAAVFASTITITDQAWHHVVATKNGSARKLYIDAVDVTAGLPANLTATDNTTTLRIGHQNAGSLRFPGSMDEIALYGAVLSPAEVLEHYLTGRALSLLRPRHRTPEFGLLLR